MTVALNLEGATAEQMLQAVTNFCRVNGAPKCYQNWSPETLRDYLSFHAAHQTLVWMPKPILNGTLNAIVGTGVAWQCNETEIRARDLARDHIFNWQPTNRSGDSVFFADFVCTDRNVLALILERFAQVHPTWRNLKWFTYRKGRLVHLTTRHVNVVLRRINYEQHQSP